MKSNFKQFLWSVNFAVLTLVFGVSSISAADFAANPATLGVVPDYPAGQPCRNPGLYANKDITFTVSGMPFGKAADDIQIKNLTFSPAHTYAGDIIATLIAPNGTTNTVIFGRIGATPNAVGGDNSDLAGPYIFDNSYSNEIWATAASVANFQNIPSGTYRSSTIGGNVSEEPLHNITQTFTAVTNTNGIWTLRFNDTCGGDTGSVSAVSLSIIHRPTTIHTSRVNDLDGDNKSDFTIVRADGASSLVESMGVTDETGKDKNRNFEDSENVSPSATQISWWTNYSTGIPYSKTYWGLDTDQFLLEDFDGDGKDDLTVFRAGAAGSPTVGFYILESATNTFRLENFGQTGDKPKVVGDWDGDGKADVAVYRDGTPQSPQSYFYYRGSNNNPNGNVTFIPFGQDGDVSFMGDFDGDGKTDPAIQRDVGGGLGAIYLLKSSNGTAFGLRWGLANDLIAPGDYDGDGKTDLIVSRIANLDGNGSFKYWFFFQANGSITTRVWGIPGDYITQGDYNGDGRTDLGVWRQNLAGSTFYVMDFNNNFNFSTRWGTSGDYPVNNWNVH